ncbi:hypothetical protein H5410_003653 [Solanum commersonii]|uniref:Uncharacterized protein n=1 Tax=Solanum commersonii TaxID=4109 RepID=A0A9J6B5L7_SOLCO|nr:hypothetical protein H5410_003653 [Solanum commersonii]
MASQLYSLQNRQNLHCAMDSSTGAANGGIWPLSNLSHKHNFPFYKIRHIMSKIYNILYSPTTKERGKRHPRRSMKEVKLQKRENLIPSTHTNRSFTPQNGNLYPLGVISSLEKATHSDNSFIPSSEV